MGVPVVFNLGMGVESTKALVDLLENPNRRDFDLADLVVVTAMTGDEFKETGELTRTHVLPLLRAHNVRYVQLARKAATVAEAGGANYVVLSDTRQPTEVHLDGCYKLSSELLDAGTLPTTAGDRKCSLKAKGEVIDAWIVDVLLGGDHTKAFRQMIGFNRDEGGRAADDCEASAKRRKAGELTGRLAEFPLIEWWESRADCLAFLQTRFGVTWPKSCCVYCPFSRGKAEISDRFLRFPQEAVLAAWMEFCSLALNPRLKLYVSKSVVDVLTDSGNVAALNEFNSRVGASETDWAVYRVRRMYRGPGLADRHIGLLAKGTRAEMEATVAALAVAKGSVPEAADGYVRAWIVKRAEPPKKSKAKKGERAVKVEYKAVEEMIVAAPRVAVEKRARGWSEEKWATRVALAMAGAPAEPVGCGG